MKRKKFIKQIALGSAGLSLIPMTGIGKQGLLPQIGETNTMKTILHKANSRGHKNHGWLNTYHTFSFASYHDPQRMNFGVLRVLNDDTVSAGMGFSKHPHDNMEIISIPLSGDLEHKDSMGNVAVIREGDVQVMSAGTGIFHSEYNKNEDKEVKFLQIWVYPNMKDVKPRYDQISLQEIKLENNFYQILSPYPNDQGVWIHQNAWFSLGNFNKKWKGSYQLNNPDNGAYFFVLSGEARIEGNDMTNRDGIGVWATNKVNVSISGAARILVMEVPMNV